MYLKNNSQIALKHTVDSFQVVLTSCSKNSPALPSFSSAFWKTLQGSDNFNYLTKSCDHNIIIDYIKSVWKQNLTQLLKHEEVWYHLLHLKNALK